jgi:hypothetical protein
MIFVLVYTNITLLPVYSKLFLLNFCEGEVHQKYIPGVTTQ